MLTTVNNITDLNANISRLNSADSWGSWDVELVSCDAIGELVRKNMELIGQGLNDCNVDLKACARYSLMELGKRVRNEPYFNRKAADEFFDMVLGMLGNCSFFEAMPESRIVQGVMEFLSDKDLSSMSSTSSKMYELGGLVKRQRALDTETVLKRIFEMINKMEDIDKRLGTLYFEKVLELFGPSRKKNEELREALIYICNTCSPVSLKIRFWKFCPLIYEDMMLAKRILRRMAALSPEIKELIWPGMESADVDEKKFTLAYLGAVKECWINPKILTVQIKGPMDKRLAEAFVEAVRHNKLIRILYIEIDEREYLDMDLLRYMLRSVNDNPYIQAILITDGTQEFDDKATNFFETFIKEHVNDILDIQTADIFLGVKGFFGSRVLCHLNKIGTYTDWVLKTFRFDNCVSEERKEALESGVKKALEGEWWKRNSALKAVIVALFKGMDEQELKVHDGAVRKILEGLSSYDEALYETIIKDLQHRL